MNVEVYANSLVQSIMLAGNDDAKDAAKEYYPAYKQEDGTAVEAINTLGVDLNGGGSGEGQSTEAKTVTVAFNGSDIESESGYFTYGDGKHNFNAKFAGTYNGQAFSQGLKMEGSTLVKFTTTAAKATIIIVQSTWSEHTLKFDNTELPLSTANTPDDSEGVRVYILSNVAAGNHQIARGSGESGILLVEVHEGATTAIQDIKVNVTGDTTYNLAGRRADATYKGIVIRNGIKQIQR